MTFFVVWRVNGDGHFVESEDIVSVWPTLEEARDARKALRTCSYVSEETWGGFKGWDARV
jgi:photosystem II stability/assembly factor-like uncharacterized protein